MGVSPGSPVSATNTNNAFLDANADDTGIGVYNFQNTTTPSGAFVNNIQAEINGQNTYAGRASNTGKDSLPVWTDTNAGTPTDSLTGRAEALTVKFNPSTGVGHDHSGAAGKGERISAPNLIAVPLKGYVLQGTDLTGVTGSSTNVTTQMTGKTPSSGPTVAGVVVTAPENKVIIRQATGVNQDDPYVDGSGNVVYARITEAAGPVWTLSYYVNLSGTETAYSFGGASDVRWYYQELFNPMSNPPVYSEFASIPSDNATADVITATTSLQGKVSLSSVAPGVVASTGSAGTANASVANADHTHEGLHSISKSGSAQILGDATLSQGSNVTLTQVGNDIQIAAASVSYRAGSQALTSGDTNKSITFSSSIGTTSYRVSVSFVNTTDSTVQYQPYTITAKSATGFSVKWNGGVDSSNYSLDYTAIVDN